MKQLRDSVMLTGGLRRAEAVKARQLCWEAKFITRLLEPGACLPAGREKSRVGGEVVNHTEV